MNKKAIWIIVAVIVVVAIVAYEMNRNSSDDNSNGLEITSGDDSGSSTPEPKTGESAELVTPDDDFSEIDDAMNYIE